MAMFFCARCQNLRDSDDGCEEAPGFRLYCVECADELAELRERRKAQPTHEIGAVGSPAGDRVATPDDAAQGGLL